MPMAIKGMADALLTPMHRATSCPMPAPMASDGANTPAGMPDQAEIQVAQSFSRV